MAIIKLPEPGRIVAAKPRPQEGFPYSAVIPLPKYSRPRLSSIERVFARRRTKRTFRAISRQQLSDLFWLTLHPKRSGRLETHPLPSFGGLHVVHVLVIHPASEPKGFCVYDRMAHALGVVACNAKVIRMTARKYATVLPMGKGKLLLFAADIRRARSVYRNPESLLWREAGVILGGMALAAEALGLSFCPLGKAGDRELGQLLPESCWVALGAAVVGR
ncbi:MAG TPA: hypothetical protein PKX00_03470 [Opitutaceae bacterium]|nr:hypothetical protein [Opitutaceae bacterium]